MKQEVFPYGFSLTGHDIDFRFFGFFWKSRYAVTFLTYILSVKTDAGEILIRMQERKDTGLDFAQIPIITTESGATILLGAIASITDGYEDTD
jgi:hypothetical protein